MRFLFGGILGLLALWAGYWMVGQRLIEGQIGTLLAQMPAGLVVQQTGYDVAGFPSRFDLTVTQPKVQTAAGWGWQAEFAQVFAMTWKPWHLIAALPHSQTLTTPFGPATLDSSRFMASFRVAPRAEADFEEAVLQIDAPILRSAGLPQITAAALIVALKHEVALGFAYRLGVQVDGLTPLVPAATGGKLSLGRMDMVVTTDRALNRTMTAVQVQSVDLRAVALEWDGVKVTGDGLLARGDGGFAEGQIALKVTGWRDLPARLADFAILRPEIAPTMTRALEVIAAEQGNPAVLDLPLIFRSGRFYLGPLPLGLAPNLDYRQ